MKNYKICVYAICKNEEKFVDRFMDSLEEIKDHVYILDTGSTDKTVEKFKSRGAHIKKKTYKKFEFDKARNDSLKLVPEDYDICISLDIDDCIEPGFISKIKENWDKDVSQLRYNYYYRLDLKDKPLTKFLCGKIHKRDCYEWKYPIHEVLKYTGDIKEKVVDVPEIIVKHRPDLEKSRAFYLGLLEEYVKEHPDNSRNVFLLAREYKKIGEWDKCIKVAHDYLKIETTPKMERGQVLSYMAKAYCNLGYYEEAELWGLKTLEVMGKWRTPYVELIKIYYDQKKYDKAIECGLEALKIKERNKYLTEDVSCWDGTIYDYLSLSYYYLGDYDNAIKYIDLDILQNPHIERLKENKEIFIKRKNHKKK